MEGERERNEEDNEGKGHGRQDGNQAARAVSRPTEGSCGNRRAEMGKASKMGDHDMP